jgi:hypothetical protein
MNVYEFIEQNKDRILNIDGNSDEGNITVSGENGCLEFYYFKDGKCIDRKQSTNNKFVYSVYN